MNCFLLLIAVFLLGYFVWRLLIQMAENPGMTEGLGGAMWKLVMK